MIGLTIDGSCFIEY